MQLQYLHTLIWWRYALDSLWALLFSFTLLSHGHNWQPQPFTIGERNIHGRLQRFAARGIWLEHNLKPADFVSCLVSP